MSSAFELKNHLAFQEAISRKKHCYVMIRGLKELFRVQYSFYELNGVPEFPAIARIMDEYVVGWASHKGGGQYEFECYDRTWINRAGPLYKVQDYQLVAWLDRCLQPSSTNVLNRIKKKMSAK